MTFRRHMWAALAALISFGVLTLVSGTWGWAALAAVAILMAGVTVLYFHYRRRMAQAAIEPVTPSRDDRIIPQAVKIAVTLRDKGRCQLRYPGICLDDEEIQFDHKVAWSNGGSSKDEENIQLACKPCNQHKSNKVLV